MSDAIHAVIFDVGGVLVRTRDHAGRRAWEERLGLGAGEAEAIVLNSEMGRRAQQGQITTTALWAWVAERLRLGDDLDAFRHDFWRGDAVDQSLVDLIRRLRPRYQLAIISNASDSLLPTLAEYGLAGEFDLIVGSATEGVMKPDPEIYWRALARLGRAPVEAVFIDDAPANVAGARAVGMAAIQFMPGIDLEGELGRLGVVAVTQT